MEKINLKDEMDIIGVANAQELKESCFRKIDSVTKDISDSKKFIKDSENKIKHLQKVIKEVNSLKKKNPKLAFWKK